MSESEIISLISKFNVETIILAILVSVFTSIIKKYIPQSLKNLIPLIPFTLGIIIYATYSFLVLKQVDFVKFATNGIQTGGVATLIYALIKQISRRSSNSKNAVTDILTGFVDQTLLSGTVSRIVKEYSLSSGVNVQKTITKIIAENSNVSESESITLANLVVKTLDTLLKKQNTQTTTK